MSFKRILRELTESVGATGAVMLDWEGEIVADYSTVEGLELDLIGAHHGIILDIIKDASACHNEGLKAGALKRVSSVVISTRGVRLIISTLKDDYYLVVTMPRSKGLVSRASYESRKAAVRLEAEMG
ncbi:MAG: roadblock/LC7 domain-containing protein [Deltaproteobacteria bacterium]|nr:roadblock/LC7 domain-containing protein [Deltaproteobacteria bacterium]